MSKAYLSAALFAILALTPSLVYAPVQHAKKPKCQSVAPEDLKVYITRKGFESEGVLRELCAHGDKIYVCELWVSGRPRQTRLIKVLGEYDPKCDRPEYVHAPFHGFHRTGRSYFGVNPNVPQDNLKEVEDAIKNRRGESKKE